MPRKKTITDPRQELVENGDFVQLLNQMLDRPASLAYPEQDLKLMAKAIRNSAAVDPGKLTDDALSSAIAFTSYMLCRAQYTVFRKIQDHDQRHQSMPPGLPPDVAQEWLPRAERIVRLLMDLSKTQAMVQARRNKDDQKTGTPADPVDVGVDPEQVVHAPAPISQKRLRTAQGPVLHGDDGVCGAMAGTSAGRGPRAA